MLSYSPPKMGVITSPIITADIHKLYVYIYSVLYTIALFVGVNGQVDQVNRKIN